MKKLSYNPPDPIWGPAPYEHAPGQPMLGESEEDRVKITEWRCANCFSTYPGSEAPTECGKCGASDFMSTAAVIRGSFPMRFRLTSDTLETIREKRAPETEQKKKTANTGGQTWQEEVEELVMAMRKSGLQAEQIKEVILEVWQDEAVGDYLDQLLMK